MQMTNPLCVHFFLLMGINSLGIMASCDVTACLKVDSMRKHIKWERKVRNLLLDIWIEWNRMFSRCKNMKQKIIFLKSKSPVFSLNVFSFLWSRANSISAPLSQSDKWKCRPQAREEVVELKKKNKFWNTKNIAKDISVLLSQSDKWKCRPKAREEIVKLQNYKNGK